MFLDIQILGSSPRKRPEESGRKETNSIQTGPSTQPGTSSRPSSTSTDRIPSKKRQRIDEGVWKYPRELSELIKILDGNAAENVEEDEDEGEVDKLIIPSPLSSPPDVNKGKKRVRS